MHCRTNDNTVITVEQAFEQQSNLRSLCADRGSSGLLSRSLYGAEETLKEYKAKNTQQRRATQKNKDRNKFSNRQGKLKDKIERKKGGVKVKRLKLRKKWQKVNKKPTIIGIT